MPPSPRSLAVSLALACALVPFTACGSADGGPAEAAGALTVRSVTIDAPANPDVAAVRLVVDNQMARSDALQSVTTPVAETASLHRSGEDAEGRAIMAEVRTVPIAARSRVRFQPGGLHVMLTGLRRRIVAGDIVALTFHFRTAGTRTVNARVVPISEIGDHSHGN